MNKIKVLEGRKTLIIILKSIVEQTQHQDESGFEV